MEFGYKLCARGQPQTQGGGRIGRRDVQLCCWKPQASHGDSGRMKLALRSSTWGHSGCELGLHLRLPWKGGGLVLSSHWGPPVPVSMGFFPLPGRGQWAGTCWWGGAGIALSPTQAFTTPSPGFPVCEFSCSLRVPMPPSGPACRKFHVHCSWKGGPRGPDMDAQVLGARCLQWCSVSVRISGEPGQQK